MTLFRTVRATVTKVLDTEPEVIVTGSPWPSVVEFPAGYRVMVSLDDDSEIFLTQYAGPRPKMGDPVLIEMLQIPFLGWEFQWSALPAP